MDEERLTQTQQPEDAGDTFIARVSRLSDARWKRYCRLGGGLLGLICGIVMFLVPDTVTFGDYKLMAVALAMLLLPRMVENQAQRSVQSGRLVMIAIFALVLAGSTVYFMATGRM